MRGDVEADGPNVRASFRYWEILITVVRGPYKGREFVFTTDVVTLGKAPQNDIPLPDETVSRQHMEILHDTQGFLLRDLGSTNGTFLDGAEIREAFLRNGSQVKVGETRFRFRAVQRRVRTEPFGEESLDGLVGTVDAMRRAFGLVRAVAPLDVTVLLFGESGSGRRSLAEVIHRRSALQTLPFTVLDCGGESPARLEKLLFHSRTGALERAEGGTVVLLEPWEIPPGLQPRVAEAIRRRRSLLSAGPHANLAAGPHANLAAGPHANLAAGPGSHPGGGQRIVSLSRRELGQEVVRGRMDEQLCASLDRVRIALPPLRERMADLSSLVSFFLAERGLEETDAGRGVAAVLETIGESMPWEGNLATLRRAVGTLSSLIEQQGLDLLQAAGEPKSPDSVFDPKRSFGENKVQWVERFERRYLEWLLDGHNGNVSRAARSADMDRKHLHRLLKRHGLR